MLQYKRKRWFNVEFPLLPSPRTEFEGSLGGFSQLPNSTSVEPKNYEMGPSPPLAPLLRENQSFINLCEEELSCENCPNLCRSCKKSLCQSCVTRNLCQPCARIPPSEKKSLLPLCENVSLPTLCEKSLPIQEGIVADQFEKSLPALSKKKLKIEEIWDEIKGDEEEMTCLVKKIGSHFGNLLSAMTLSLNVISVEQMMTSSLEEEYGKFPKLIVTLFEQMAISKTNFREESQRESAWKKKIQMIHCCLNIVMKCRDLRSISVFSLSVSLYIYWVSRSKVLLNVLSHFGVSVSYVSVRRYEQRFAAALPPKVDELKISDFVIWFDNLQKSWCSTRTSILKTAAHIGVITNIVTFQFPGSQLTRQSTLHPLQWRWNSCATIQNFLLDEMQANMLNSFLESFLEKIFISEISEKQSEAVTKFLNAQDEDVVNQNTKECPKCRKRFKRTDQKCHSCDVKLPLVGTQALVSSSMEVLKKSSVSDERRNLVTLYVTKEGELEKSSPIPLRSIEIVHREKPIPSEKHEKVVFLDPVSGNPSSYVVVEKVLNGLVDQFPERTFLPVCVDGSPLRLMYESLRDEKCSYGKIIPFPGLGHEQMNMISSYFSLIWPFWMGEFCKAHGFTKDQKEKFIKVFDTHKCAEALQIMLEGIVKEQIREYLSWCKIKHLLPSLPHFLLQAGLRWKSESPSSARFNYLHPVPPTPPTPSTSSTSSDLSFSWMSSLLLPGLAILAFVHSVRTCQYKTIHAARLAFLDVWFTLPHPIYRFVIPSFIRDLVVMPDSLRENVQRWTVGSNTGNEGKFQGLDFVGEELNKVVKGGLPPSPSFDQWKSSVRMIPLIKKIRFDLEMTNLLPNTVFVDNFFVMRFQPDIISWRSSLRRSHLFQLPWHSMDGQIVSNVNVFPEAAIQKQHYIQRDILQCSKTNEPATVRTVSFFKREAREKSQKKNQKK
jgi:hypothetical protein